MTNATIQFASFRGNSSFGTVITAVSAVRYEKDGKRIEETQTHAFYVNVYNTPEHLQNELLALIAVSEGLLAHRDFKRSVPDSDARCIRYEHLDSVLTILQQKSFLNFLVTSGVFYQANLFDFLMQAADYLNKELGGVYPALS